MPLLYDTPFLAAYALLGAALGRFVLRRLRADARGVRLLERGVLSASIGLGLLQFVPFALGSVGLLTPGALWVVHGVLFALFLPGIAAVVRAAARVRLPRPRGWMAAGAALLGVALAVSYLYGLGPVTDPDGLAYHMTAPRRWLGHGSLVYLPTLVHTNAPMGVEMLIAAALGMWSDTAAKAITWVLGALMLAAAFALGRRCAGSAAGLAAVLLILLGFHKLAVLALMGMAYIDLGVVGQVLAAFLGLVLWRHTRSAGWLWAAALCAGLAGSFKLTAITAGGALALLAALYPPPGEAATARRRIGRAAIALAIALAPVVPWLWRTWYLTGNPVWPVLASVFPTRDMTVEGAARFAEYFRLQNWGTRSAVGWSREVRVAVWASAMAASALAAVLAAWRIKSAEVRLPAVGAGVLLTAAIFSTGLYLRFLLPVYALGCVALAVALGPPLRRVPALGWALAALALVNLVLGLRAAYPSVRDVFAAATGLMPRETYLRRNLPLAIACERANMALPRDAVVLSGAGGGLYYMDRRTVVVWPNNQWLRSDTWNHFVSDLQRRGVGYVIVGEAGSAGPPHQQLLDAYGEPMGPPVDGAQLYRLQWSRGPAIDPERDASLPPRRVPGF